MDRRCLGRTELVISEIGLGCQSLGGGLYYRNDREAIRVLHRAAEAGINFFDTADHYGLGLSESLIGKAFRGRRNAIILSTKVGTTYSAAAKIALRARPLLRPFRWALRRQKLRIDHIRAAQRRHDLSPAYLERATDNCLRRLRTDYLDLLMLHKPPLAELQRGECLTELAKLQSKGKIRYYGVCCDGIKDARVALGIPGVSAIQITISLLDQAAIPEILPLAKRMNCGVIARNPRGQGHLTSEYSDIMAETYVEDASEAELRQKAARRFSFLANEKRTIGQAAIKFVQQFDAIQVVVPRAVNLAQLNDVLGTLNSPPISVQDMAMVASTTESIRPMLKSHPYRR
ncbi:MAG: aldo/keto reductase [Steroidobacteraceae bacterium]